MTTAIEQYTYTSTGEHGLAELEMTLGNQFQAVCKCGVKCKTGSNPSAAHQALRDHVNRASAPEALPAVSEGGAAPQARPASSRPAGTLSRPSRGGARPCACRCGETTGGGTFRPGHDAKFLSKLTARLAAREITAAEALAELDAMPALKAKLAKRLAGN